MKKLIQILLLSVGIIFSISIYNFTKPYIITVFVISILLILVVKTIIAKEKANWFIILLCIFFAMPTIAISQAQISKQENRTLAQKPNVLINKKYNYDYANEYNDYISERFTGREFLVKFLRKTKCNLNTTICGKDVLYNKRSGWTFVEGFIPKTGYNENELNLMVKNVEQLQKFCKRNGIKPYIIIIPTTGCIYPEAIFPYQAKIENGEIVKNYINSKTKSNIIIYPYKEMKKASETDYVMPKFDVHWTEYGAFTGYKALMNQIKQDIPSLNILNEKDFIITKRKQIRTMYPYPYTNGFNYGRFDHPKEKLTEEYKTYQYKDTENYKYSTNETTMSESTKLDTSKNKQKIFLIGSSYSDNLSLFLRYSFAEMEKRRTNNMTTNSDKFLMNNYDNEILKYKPDILIIAITIVGIPQLTEIYPNGEE